MDRLWIERFLEAIAAEKGAAGNTLLAYARDLVDFSDWLARGAQSLETAEREEIEAYLIAMDDEGLSRATRARRLSAIRQFFRFLFVEGLRADNPSLRITGPRPERRLPLTLSEEDVTRLIDQMKRYGRTATDKLRNAALIELLYATGLRVTELVSLPVAAVRGDPRMILVRGKGGKERMVPLSDPAREAVADWLAARTH